MVFSVRWLEMIRRSPSDLEQILAYDHGTPEVAFRGIEPHRVGHVGIVGRNEVREDQCLDAGVLRDAAGVLRRGLMGEDARLQRRRIRHTSNEAVDGGWI